MKTFVDIKPGMIFQTNKGHKVTVIEVAPKYVDYTTDKGRKTLREKRRFLQDYKPV